jgi:hypothetical protein
MNGRTAVPFKDKEKERVWRRGYIRRYLADPVKRKHVNAIANARAHRIRRWLDQYKIQVGCVDCGFAKHPAALDFDHAGTTKTINVCFAKSIRAAQKEMFYCVVRCSNCHRIKHAEAEVNFCSRIFGVVLLS